MMEQGQATGMKDLLQTKLVPPRLHSLLVRREALLARLDEGLARKLTLLSAPAGFGKTTLVSQWLQRTAVAWLSLDAGDNDPIRFWRYFFTSCQRFGSNLGATALAQLQTPQPPGFETLLTPLINELAGLPDAATQRHILVLEDYHLITNPQLHAAVTFLLDHLPPTLHLVVTTRRDPPLPLARLRARLEINDLTAADLRFSPAETAIFLQQTLTLPLTPTALAALDARTEGWVTGLRLATLALQSRKTPAEVEHFLATFTGSHRHILAYLVDEVLATQLAAVQEFLLQTTSLNRLTASLCNAVTARDDSAVILDQLARANLFLIPLDESGSWYRYHTLFAEAMQHLAQQRLGIAALRTLSNRASQWYATQGLLAEAVEMALAAEAFDGAADLITQLIAPRLVSNEYSTLRRWLGQLPEATLRDHPALCFTYALAIQFTADRRAPETMTLLATPLRLAEEQWQAQGNQRQLGAVHALRAMAAWWQGDLVQTFQSAHAALAVLPPDERQWRSISLLFTSTEALFAGQFKTAHQTVMTARRLCEEVGNIYGLISATNLMAEILSGQGELHQAASLYRQAITLIDEHRLQTDQAHFDRARALIGLAAIHLAWQELAAAQTAAEAACDHSRQIDEEIVYTPATFILAEVRQAQGQLVEAQQLLHTLMAQLPQRRWPFLVRAGTRQQARLALAAGDLAAVQRWAASLPPAVNIPLLHREAEAFLQVRLHLACAEPEAALRLLEPWQRDAQTGGRGRSQVEIHLLTALAYCRQEKLPQAKAALRTALMLAQPQGEQRLFLAEADAKGCRQPSALTTLLQALLPEVKEELLRAYVRTLLLALAKEPLPARSSASSPGFLLEPLSAQEERVLRLVTAGLSNPEIARELIVSVNTVKTQVQSIFRKLNVNNRQEARDIAQQLNLR